MQAELIALALLAVTAAPAAAQLTVEQARAKADHAPVIVVNQDGQFKGRLLEMDRDSVTIELKGGQPQTFKVSGVLRIEAPRRDSLANGALFGSMVLGFGCMIVCGLGGGADDAWGAILLSAVAGAAVGGGIDATMMKKHTLYSHASPPPPRNSRGLYFTVRF